MPNAAMTALASRIKYFNRPLCHNHSGDITGVMSNRLASRRAELGLKQAEVAAEVGISQPLLAQWEKGQISRVVVSALLLARRYGVSCEELFGDLLDAAPVPESERIDTVPPPPARGPRRASGVTRAATTAPAVKVA